MRSFSKSVPAIPRNPRWTSALEETSGSSRSLEIKIRERTAALLASEEKYRLLLENANEAILVLQEGAIKFANPMATNIWGYSFKELKSLPFDELLSESDQLAWKVYVKRIAAEPTDSTACFKSMTKEGHTRWIEVRATHITWEGKPGTLTLLTDITERKQAEETLRQNEKRFRALIEHSADAVSLVKADGTVSYSSPSCVRMLGYSQEERLGRNTFELVHPDDREHLLRLFSGILIKPGQVIVPPTRVRHADGSWRWIEGIAHNLLAESSVQAIVVNFRDITEQKLAEDELRKNYEKLQRAMDGAVKALALLAERRDPYTAGHQQRVARLAVGIAQELGLPQEEIETMAVAGLLHDIGKVSVPTEILSKPSKLNQNEFNLLRGHSRVSYDIVKTLGLPWAIDQIVLQHHERLDGSGYPQGLAGESITLGAKILGVADVVEAMVSHRPYRAALGLDKALEEISEKKGILYDSVVVDACLKLFEEKGFKLEENTQRAVIGRF